MKSEYDPILYMDSASYQTRYYNKLEEYFPEAGERVEVYVGMLVSVSLNNFTYRHSW